MIDCPICGRETELEIVKLPSGFLAWKCPHCGRIVVFGEDYSELLSES